MVNNGYSNATLFTLLLTTKSLSAIKKQTPFLKLRQIRRKKTVNKNAFTRRTCGAESHTLKKTKKMLNNSC